MASDIPDDILYILRAIKAKRPKTVIDHIIDHGFVTTEELKETYGYSHAPRAARDVRELGVPLETFTVKDATGRSIGAYRFAKWEYFRVDRLEGRVAFSKQFKEDLVAHYGKRCSVCSISFEKRYLQIDHRVPYEIAGDDAAQNRIVDDYMLVCSSCNRAKSWSCGHCLNGTTQHDSDICQNCYWASPLNYQHIAMNDIRRLALVWQGSETNDYDALKRRAAESQEEMPVFVKRLLLKMIARD